MVSLICIHLCIVCAVLSDQDKKSDHWAYVTVTYIYNIYMNIALPQSWFSMIVNGMMMRWYAWSRYVIFALFHGPDWVKNLSELCFFIRNYAFANFPLPHSSVVCQNVSFLKTLENNPNKLIINDFFLISAKNLSQNLSIIQI